MAMKKKAAAPEPAGESAPMWIVSFADLVTLMMSFFVVLYAMKQGGEKQQMDTMAAIKATFDPAYEPPADANPEFLQAYKRYKGIPGPPVDTLPGASQRISKGADGANAEVQTIRMGKDNVTGGKITFDVGETKISPEAADTITQIADRVRGLNLILMVKGHVSADELPLRPDDPQGLSLSYRRATAVIQELIKDGIDQRTMRPVACGAYEPLRTGVYDAAGLRENRRVEVFTTEATASEFAPTPTVAPADPLPPPSPNSTSPATPTTQQQAQ
ncbi:MAG TPA: flagellar motor protein MotB [Phycisphaerae bacterium]|nr:flagellar motor protein MotB [Phycisphaerae bacterium]